jgi:subtilase family serine protease
VTWWKRRPARQQALAELPRLRGSQRVTIVRAAAAVTATALAATAALACDSHAASSVQHSIGAGPSAPRATTSRVAPGGGLTPAQIRAAYGLPPIADLAGPGPLKNITGKGQTIVIVDSFGSPTITADLARFDSYFRLPAPPSFRVIQPVGKVPAYHAGNSNRVGWAAETTLDVEWAHVMAPGARIVLVETPTSENEGTTGFPQIVAAEKYVLRHKLGQVISQSFAATEQTFPARSDYAALRDLRSAYLLAAADHVTVLAASGDQGATGDKYNMVDEYTSPAVSWPGTDPLVTAIGGTQLKLRPDGTRVSPDVAWNDSGGGRSIIFPRPSFQDSVQSITGSRRGVPDISMDASCRSSVAVYSSFSGADGGRWSTSCGTSLAAPLFAGIVALADQYAGHPVGLINPAIYQIEAKHEQGIVDVTKGNNTQTFMQGGRRHTVRGFSAGPGYDLVTGAGTINAAYFVPELAKLRR